VGLPYAVLATTSPLLQRRMSLINVDLRVIRYFAVSNFGSFPGLLSAGGAAFRQAVTAISGNIFAVP
jgi:hypothetical protein